MKKMKIEDQVASVWPSKKLRELGVKQDSLWYWNDYIASKPSLSEGKRFEDKLATDGTYIQYSVSAFTVAELGEMLPARIKTDYGGWTYLHITKRENTKEWVIDYNYLLDIIEIRENREADTRAKMLIYLIKEGFIKVEDIK